MTLINRKFFFTLFSALSLFVQCSQSQNFINVNFSKKVGNGSALMFGGNNYGFSSQVISDTHKNAGFNVARYDALMNEIVPNSTITAYKNNLNGIQNPDMWNWQRIDKDLDMLNRSGFKVLLIINYCPLWLETNEQRVLNKESINATPADWQVYEDIVKKVFEHVQNRIYAAEVWNEPDLGLKIEGTPYKTVVNAYLDLYGHTAEAIRSVNKGIKIGGPAMGNTYDTSFLNALLDNKQTKKNFDFYSYHFYGVQKEGNISTLRKIAAEKGKPNFPIFISEWNYSADFDKNPMNTNAVDAISFIGNTIINQYKESPYLSVLYCMDDYKKADSFYTMDINDKLVPKVGVIRLMALKLGLGAGQSELCKTIYSDNLNAIGGFNVVGNPIVCAVNYSKHQIITNIKLNGLKNSGRKLLTFFLADESHDATKPYKKINATIKNSSTEIVNVSLPPNSVIGIIIL